MKTQLPFPSQTIKRDQITARVSVSARVFVCLPMNPGSPCVGGAGRDADWKLWEENIISHKADLHSASPYRNSTYGQGRLCCGASCMWLSSQIKCLLWTGRLPLRNYKNKTPRFWTERWIPLSGSDTPPGKTEEMVLVCVPRAHIHMYIHTTHTCIHICKGNII